MLKQTDKSSIESSCKLREMSNLETAIECLECVATDLHPRPNMEYFGFINIDPSDFQNPRWSEFFSTLHKTHKYFQVVFEHFGLELESAVETEVVIIRKNGK